MRKHSADHLIWLTYKGLDDRWHEQYTKVLLNQRHEACGYRSTFRSTCIEVISHNIKNIFAVIVLTCAHC